MVVHLLESKILLLADIVIVDHFNQIPHQDKMRQFLAILNLLMA